MNSLTIRIEFKRIAVGASLLLMVFVGLANAPLASQKQIGMFLNSTTCVVLESGINPYNGFIKDAVEKHWKTTPFEFISEIEFEARRFDSRYSFLVLMINVFDLDPAGVSYNYISLVMGGSAKDLSKMPEICNIPLYYTDDINHDYEYAIPAIVKFIQKHAKNLEHKRFLISINGLNYYKSSGFKQKQLLMNRNKMAPDAFSTDKINSVYPYYIKLLTATEMQVELDKNPKNALFHFHVGPSLNRSAGKCFEMIFDVDGNLYYYHSRMITNKSPDGFNMRDFNRIK
jgi:hypothetical protein